MNGAAVFRRAAAWRWLPMLLLWLGAPNALRAQQIAGSVVRSGNPVAGVLVTLHRVTRAASGPVARVTAAADGTFRVLIPPPPDTAVGFSVYFATADVEGVRYFGAPIHRGDRADRYQIIAYDTTSSAAAIDSIRVGRRDIAFVSEAQGGWEVGEVVRLENRSGRTIVPQPGRPVVAVPLPQQISAFDVGDGDVAASEVVRIGDAAALVAPFPPGRRDLYVRYRILKGRRELVIPMMARTDSVNVFIRQPALDAAVTGLGASRRFDADGEQYVRYSGAGVPAAQRVLLRRDGPAPSPVDARWAAVAMACLILVGAAAAAVVRRRNSRGPRALPPSRESQPRPPAHVG